LDNKIKVNKHLQRRHEKQAKQTDRLKPNGKWTGYGALTSPYVNLSSIGVRDESKLSIL